MSWYNDNEPENENESSQWYAPNHFQAAPHETAKPKSKLPGDRKTRIIAIIASICLVIICIGVALTEPERHDVGKNADGMPKSWQEYYNTIYSSAPVSNSQIILPRVDELGTLELIRGADSASVLSFSEIFDKCSPSVVGIRCFPESRSDVDYAWGTGMIVSSDGYILTNAHVIDNGKFVTVDTCDGISHDAKLVGADTQSDIAILKIEQTGLKPVSFASSSTLNVGDTVVAIGNPISSDYSLSMTSGIISATSREVSANGGVMTLLQTDTSINEGSSGGPLINERGQVVGITNMKIVSRSSSVEGIGFAIPSDNIFAVVKKIMAGDIASSTATIGITVGPIDKDIAAYYDIPTGLYVSDVVKGTDAEKQGIRRGDIITEVNGNPVFSTSDIADAKAKLDVGDQISFTIWRDGKSVSVDVTLVDAKELN